MREVAGRVERDAAAGQCGRRQCAGADAAAVDDLGGADADAAGRAAIGTGIGTDAAAVLDALAGIEHNLAGAHLHAGGFKFAGVFDHAALQAIDRACRENDEATGRQHGTLVFDQRLDLRGLDRDVVQAAFAIKLQRDRLARGQCHGAELCDDDTFVADFGREQGYEAVQRGADVAFVDDTAAAAVAAELELAGHEIGVFDVARGGHQRTHIHRCALAKVDAVRVDKIDLAVGGDLAQNLARVAVEHTIQRGAATGGLLVVDLRLRADVEGVPVDDGAVAALVHIQVRAALVDASAASRDLRPGGQLGWCR